MIVRMVSCEKFIVSKKPPEKSPDPRVLSGPPPVKVVALVENTPRGSARKRPPECLAMKRPGKPDALCGVLGYVVPRVERH
jgi:hypothetical protein